MSIALCGAHRVGKSTIAKTFSEETGIPYIESTVNLVGKELGLNVNADLSFDDRMFLQEHVLKDHIKNITAITGPFITDRSPIDFAAYALGTLGLKSFGNSDQDKRLMCYIDECILATNRMFSLIVLVQPGIAYIDEEGKPNSSSAYQELIHNLCSSWVHDDRIKMTCFKMSRVLVDPIDRVNAVKHLWGNIVEESMSNRPKILH